jgi:hypothetical protein
MRYFEREVVLVPDLHDFWITVVMRSRRQPDPVRELLFTIRLKFAEASERRYLEKINNKEFVPWQN